MTGLLLGEHTYSRLHRVGLLRRDLVPRLLSRAQDCFPGLTVSHVDLDKHHDNDEFTIDLTFIDLPAGRWWAGAVFTGFDDFETDVAFPLTWMRRVTYLTDEIESICATVSEDQRATARELVGSTVPSPVAFVSSPRPEWYEIARSHEGQLAVLESFTTPDHPASLLRVNGELPAAIGTHVGTCKVFAGQAHILKVDGIALGDGTEHECSVEWDGEHLPWQARPLEAATLLVAPGVQPDLPVDEDLELFELAINRYVLRRPTEEDR